MTQMRTLKDLIQNELTNKYVLVRVDFNLPLINGKIQDDTRLCQALPTIKTLSQKGAKLVIASHFGRPKGKPSKETSLAPIAKKLSELLAKPVAFLQDCLERGTAFDALPENGVCILENTRFYKQEENNDNGFAKSLAKKIDYYVNDAFSASHRAHASTTAITHHLPSFAGLALMEELHQLTYFLSTPKHPIIGLIGGAKISTKINLLKHLCHKLDVMVLGGAMANGFLKANNIDIGCSFYEQGTEQTAKEILYLGKENNCNIILPQNVITAKKLQKNAPSHNRSIDNIPKDEMILDIGKDSIKTITTQIEKAKTCLWNGPLGVFETPPFDEGTNAIAKIIGKRTRDNELLSIAGGGDTIAALKHTNQYDQMSYVSSGGGAFLEWLEGKKLPAIAALETNHHQHNKRQTGKC